MTVNHTTFRRIAQGLQQNRFAVNTGIEFGKAAYNSENFTSDHPFHPGRRSGTFLVNPGWAYRVGSNADFESLVVHESVHASFDLCGCILPMVDNEAAAHIAQGYFYMLNCYGPDRVTVLPVRIATQIAASIMTSGSVPVAELNRLRTTLQASETYRRATSQTYTGNG